jgi:hypothetical protein
LIAARDKVRNLILIGFAQVLLVVAGCGGGSGGSVAPANYNGQSAANVVPMTVDSGPTGNDADTPFVTVTVCAPGSTTDCQQIDHVEVDTGSYGLRIISSVLSSSLASALQQEVDSGGTPIVECTQFVDGFSWGPVKVADLQIGGESAGNVPVQVIGDSAFQSEIPTGCSSTGKEEDTVAAFGANGILGVGPFPEDCGGGCVTNAANGVYYACPPNSTSTSACSGATVSASAQVTNPVVFFQTDNNGVVVQLPAVADPGGSSTASGTLVFGIGTEGNNGLAGAAVLTGNPSSGDITTTYNGQSLPYSYFDTGSNAYYFVDKSIPDCPSSGTSGSSSSWFCPTSELTLNASNAGQNGVVSDVTFYIENADTLFSTYSGNTAFDDLGADAGDQTSICGSSNCSFDFGLPFFFGRAVYVAIYGQNTPGGQGPYFAY